MKLDDLSGEVKFIIILNKGKTRSLVLSATGILSLFQAEKAKKGAV